MEGSCDSYLVVNESGSVFIDPAGAMIASHWFDEHPATMYAQTFESIFPELAAAAGGCDALLQKATELANKNEWEKVLHMTGVICSVEPGNLMALPKMS